jgi:hypothetical protein
MNSGFTRHAHKRLKERGITHDEVRKGNSNLLCVVRSEENDVITAYRRPPSTLRKFKGLGNFANPSVKITLEKKKSIDLFTGRGIKGYIHSFKRKYRCNLVLDRETNVITIVAPQQSDVDRAKSAIMRYVETSVLPSI